VGEDHGKPVTGNTTLFGKRIDTVIQAATGGALASQLESALVDIDTREMDSRIGCGQNVAGQPGAATDITAGCPFAGRRNAVYSGATDQVLDMRFRVEAGGIGDSNL
jgi:hypothetical protein